MNQAMVKQLSIGGMFSGKTEYVQPKAPPKVGRPPKPKNEADNAVSIVKRPVGRPPQARHITKEQDAELSELIRELVEDEAFH